VWDACHIGWFGLFSTVVTILIQLHYGFCVVNKGLGMVTELARGQLLNNKRKKRLNCTYKKYQRQVRVIREVLYIIKLMRLPLPIVDKAACLIIPFWLLF